MKLNLCWMIVSLLIASSSVTAQVHPMHKDNKQSLWHKLILPQPIHSAQKLATSEANLAELKLALWEDDDWAETMRIRNEFDGDKITASISEAWTGSSWTEVKKTTFSYEDGLLISEQYEELDEMGEVMIPVEKYRYSYEVEGDNFIVTEILYQEWSTGGETGIWIDSGKDEFVHDNFTISSGTYSEWSGQEWVAIEKFTTADSDSGAILTYLEYLNNDWTFSYREIYTGLTIQEVYDFFVELSYGFGSEEFYLQSTYFPDYIYQIYENDEWLNEFGQFTNKYYDLWSGSITKSEVSTKYWDEDWITQFISELWFNGNTNPDSANFYIGDGEEKILISQDLYTYDNENLMTEAITMADEGEGLMNAIKYEFTWSEVSTGIKDPAKPTAYSLKPAYPNPFNPATNITYSLERAGDVKIQVYDVLGRFVATLASGQKPAGEHHVQFDAGNLSSGLYIVRMESAGYLKTQMVTLLK